MVRFLFENENNFSRKFERLLEKRESIDSSVEDIVDEILKNVKRKSDKSLIEYTNKLHFRK